MNRKSDLVIIKKKRNSDIDARIGKNLRRIREKSGISQSELSRMIGSTPGRISDIETGKRRVSITFLELISERLDCDPIELFIIS